MESQRHRVFITGGTGYVGRPLINLLLGRGHAVRALVRPGSEKKLPPGCHRFWAMLSMAILTPDRSHRPTLLFNWSGFLIPIRQRPRNSATLIWLPAAARSKRLAAPESSISSM